jgi:hypothetical protein
MTTDEEFDIETIKNVEWAVDCNMQQAIIILKETSRQKSLAKSEERARIKAEWENIDLDLANAYADFIMKRTDLEEYQLAQFNIKRRFEEAFK